MKALVLVLRGPMRSWGGLSIGDDRWTQERPTCSALVGMLAACVGIDREDHESLHAWFRSWTTVSLRGLEWSLKSSSFDLPRRPSIMSDYHTASNSMKMDGSLNDNAVVTRRGYIEDAREVVAFIVDESAPAEIFDAAIQGLKSPAFTPYLGRRCNAFSQPLWQENAAVEFNSASELMDVLQARLLQPGLCEEGAIEVREYEACADAEFLREWWQANRDTLEPKVLTHSEMDRRMDGARKHASRVTDLVTWSVIENDVTEEA